MLRLPVLRLPVAAALPVLLLAACGATKTFPEATGTPAEPAARSHALVVSGSPLIPGRAGSGVVLDGTRIVTNRHVVAPRGQVLPVSVTMPDGSRRQVAEVRISDRMDLAVLALAGPALPGPCWREAAPAVGEQQWLIGSPADGPTLTTGQVLETDVPDAKFGALYAVGTSVAPGYSGGAAVDGRGCVAGITTAASGEGVGARAWALASPQVLREIARLGGSPAVAQEATSLRASVGR